MSNMKCPECGNDTTQLPMSLPEKNYCPECGWFREIQQTFIDPAELLRLIDAARERPYIPSELQDWDTLNAILAYLSGDPGPLKKLAGE